ncbi:helix-turn-helix domain-containing protein [Polycladomyces subterraneus]|uniref:Helix-turn-helix domain-containing protein n=1 Tax=Polycladomyces subterraneus TaxID=1016997 RepID=A0ABT8IJW9_9BACL|nr:helix-turn-helix transcriptional regulator [Polycladomyces subterraneus]MDN4593091.1 helix-turn-helix domain-containing protein [Polycladomyces subterraneus]
MSKLKEARTAAGLSQKVLAEKSGLSVNVIRSLEQGKKEWTRELAEKLAPHLGVSVDTLMRSGKKVDSSKSKKKQTKSSSVQTTPKKRTRKKSKRETASSLIRMAKELVAMVDEALIPEPYHHEVLKMAYRMSNIGTEMQGKEE